MKFAVVHLILKKLSKTISIETVQLVIQRLQKAMANTLIHCWNLEKNETHKMYISGRNCHYLSISFITCPCSHWSVQFHLRNGSKECLGDTHLMAHRKMPHFFVVVTAACWPILMKNHFRKAQIKRVCLSVTESVNCVCMYIRMYIEADLVCYSCKLNWVSRSLRAWPSSVQ